MRARIVCASGALYHSRQRQLRMQIIQYIRSMKRGQRHDVAGRKGIYTAGNGRSTLQQAGVHAASGSSHLERRLWAIAGKRMRSPGADGKETAHAQWICRRARRLFSDGSGCYAIGGVQPQKLGGQRHPSNTDCAADLHSPGERHRRPFASSFNRRGEKWLLPTPTPVDAGLFDKVFGKPRALETPANPAQETQSALGIVLVASLNVRSGPGLEHAVIAAVSAGDRLPVVEQTGGWVRLSLPDGRTGWSAQEYVAIDGDVQAAAVSPSAGAKAVILADMLNVREQPDLGGIVIAALGRQECVDILEQQDGWVRVSLPTAKSGWCFGQYVQEVAVCPTPAAPNPTPSAAPPPPRVRRPRRRRLPQQPLKPNASVVMSTHLHECFGGGWDELRYVRGHAGAGVGRRPVCAAGQSRRRNGAGTVCEDSSVGWAVCLDRGEGRRRRRERIAQISGQCEPGDRIDWARSRRLRPRRFPCGSQQRPRCRRLRLGRRRRSVHAPKARRVVSSMQKQGPGAYIAPGPCVSTGVCLFRVRA